MFRADAGFVVCAGPLTTDWRPCPPFPTTTGIFAALQDHPGRLPRVIVAPPDQLPSTPTAYRRNARRLRCRFRNDPAALHLSLKRLAVQADEASARARVATVASPPVVVRVKAVQARRNDLADLPDRHVIAENIAAAELIARQTDTIASGLESPRDVVSAFADLVRESLGEGILRFDQRTSLYRQAAAMKIDRFEASLIIAAIEHRHGMNATPRKPAGHRRSVAGWVVSLLAIECVVAAAALAFMR